MEDYCCVAKQVAAIAPRSTTLYVVTTFYSWLEECPDREKRGE